MPASNSLIYQFVSFSIGILAIGFMFAQTGKNRKKEDLLLTLFYLSFTVVIAADLIRTGIDSFGIPGITIALSPVHEAGIHGMIVFAPLYTHNLKPVIGSRKRNLFFIILPILAYMIPFVLRFTDRLSLEGTGYFLAIPIFVYSFIVRLKRFPYQDDIRIRRTHRLWLILLAALILSQSYELLLARLIQWSETPGKWNIYITTEKNFVPAVYSLFGLANIMRILMLFLNTPETSDGMTEQTGQSRIPGFSELTAREREVLDLLLEGQSNGSIAENLSISLGTVKTHIGRIFSKTGTKSRFELLALNRKTEPGPKKT